MLAELHPRLPTLLERSASWVGRRPIALAVISGGIIATATLFTVCARWGAEAPLFDADLRPSQAAEVENALTLWGEPFHANAQGTQISVPAARKSDVLLRLTLAGLPRRYMPTSADVLESPPSALTPQSVIDDRRRSGIEGDLVAGLRRIAGVADATVVLPPASSDPLGDPAHDAPPTAAVQLVLAPGADLSTDAVSGIRRFVASAYPGLSSDRVTVVDASGAALGSTAPPIDGAAAKERRIQTAVQSALDAVLGAGSAVVRVSVRTAGTEQQTQTTRTVAGAPVSSDVARERGLEAGRSFEKERTVRRYAYDTISERKTMTADAQTKISVAVFLDARRLQPNAKDAIASLVRAAAGADLKAGDEVVVESVPFAAPASPSPSSPASPQPAAAQAFVPAAVACALALLGFAAIPRIPRQVVERLWQPVPMQAGDARPEGIDSRAAPTFESLAGESAQTAAYVMRSLDDAHREGVLRLCSPDRRAAIRSFLDR